MNIPDLTTHVLTPGVIAWECAIDGIKPEAAALALKNRPGLIWLDSATEDTGSWSYLCCDPIAQISAPAGQAERALSNVSSWINPPPTLLEPEHGPRFKGGAVGYIAYDAAFDLLPDLTSRHRPVGPATEFGLYDTLIAIDHSTERTLIRSYGIKDAGAPSAEHVAREKICSLIEDLGRYRSGADRRQSVDWEAVTSREAHTARIDRAKQYIFEGDIYQANLAQAFTSMLGNQVDPFDLYLQMRLANPAPYGAWLDLGARQIASTSPERLISLSTGRIAEARPIKGTCRRSSDPAEDDHLRNALLVSEKDRAENIMIVDLLRNDLSRVCEPGSVEVPTLCGLETYAGLHHLTSEVRGTLRRNLEPIDLLRAVFPGGSITGAPKHRAIEIIDELEAGSRGAFCGSLGYIGFDGAMDFNILIRTVEFMKKQGCMMAGGGITLLSEADKEYDETLLKGAQILSSTGRSEVAA